MKTKYWIAAISQEHIKKGEQEGFIQVCHGKQAPLKRMTKGDLIAVYSSKVSMEGNEKLQKFTAIGEVKDDEIYQYQMTENFNPFRRNIEFFDCKETPIQPLIEDLEFIKNKEKWGFPFRYGFFEISERDFHLISSKMLQKEPQNANI